MASATQRSFAGGELSPAVYGRTDQQKYANGLRIMRNFIAQRHGGAANRPGTRFVAATKTPTDVMRIVEFIYNNTQTYVLEFANRCLRFIQSGGQVVVSGAPAWSAFADYTVGDTVTSNGASWYCYVDQSANALMEPGDINGLTQYESSWIRMPGGILEIPTPYLAADLAELQVKQSADVMTLTHQNYPPMELRRYSHTKWVLTTINFAPEISPPSNLVLAGGVAGVDTTYAVTALKESTYEESLPATKLIALKVPASGTPITVSWDKVPGAVEYNVYRSADGTSFGFIGVAGGTPSQVIDNSWVTSSDSASTSTPGVLVISSGQARNDCVASGNRAFDGKYRVTGTLLVSATTGSPTGTTGRARLYYKRDAETRIDSGLFIKTTLEGLGGKSVDFDITIDVPDNGYATLQIDLVPEVLGSGTSTFTSKVTGTQIEFKVSSANFSDANIAPDFNISPPVQQALFDGPTKYPAASAYYQQRRLFANTALEPEKVWASRTGIYKNFALSTPLQPDDRVIFSMVGEQVNAVQHLLDVGRLLVMTSGGEHEVQGNQDGALTPTTVNPRRISANGIGRLRPLVVGNSVLYVQARGTIVRDLQQDAIQGFTGNDLTIFASHLFDNFTLIDWAYQKIPHSIIWLVRSDGVLLGLTYIKEQAVWAWHRHDTDGFIENVCCVPEGNEDRLYLLVRRVINGATVRYVEELATRTFTDGADAFFVDCGLSYDGTNTSALSLSIFAVGVPGVGVVQHASMSAPYFTAGDVGHELRFKTSDGVAHVFTITEYVTSQEVTGTYDVPGYNPGAGPVVIGTTWAKAVSVFGNLGHLEGKAVAILADGAVVASPNNTVDFLSTTVVTGGQVTLSAPAVKVHVGLPITADLGTLDLDTPATSVKDKKGLLNRIGLIVERTRTVYAGSAEPAASDTGITALTQYLPRDVADSYEVPAIVTETIHLNVASKWTDSPRMFIRQVDPVPLTILALFPSGYLNPT